MVRFHKHTMKAEVLREKKKDTNTEKKMTCRKYVTPTAVFLLLFRGFFLFCLFFEQSDNREKSEELAFLEHLNM